MASNVLSQARQEKLVRRLAEVLQYSTDNNEFFSRKYEGVDLKEFTVEALSAIPYLTRAEVQDNYPFGLVCRPLSEIPTYYETSGSTGGPIPVFPEEDPVRDAQLAAYINSWMGLGNGKVQMAIVALPYEMNPMGLKFHRALRILGITVIPASVRTTLSPPAKVIDLIQVLRPSLVIGRPLEIMRYAEGMQLKGMDPSACSIRKIFFTGETISKSKWRRISRLFGDVELYSTYGLTELDVGLTTCEEGHYHLPPSDSLILEIVDSDGKAVSEGCDGEIVISALRESIVPYVRYRTGDVGRFSSYCACGALTPHIIIRGRAVDQVNINGKALFPVDVENVILQDPSIGCEYQLVLDSSSLTVNAEAAFGEHASAALADKLRVALAAELQVDARVNLVGHNQLADKFGIAKGKGCRFVNVTGLSDRQRRQTTQINYFADEDMK